jgi:hypothetical protein
MLDVDRPGQADLADRDAGADLVDQARGALLQLERFDLGAEREHATLILDVDVLRRDSRHKGPHNDIVWRLVDVDRQRLRAARAGEGQPRTGTDPAIVEEPIHRVPQGHEVAQRGEAIASHCDITSMYALGRSRLAGRY